MIRFDLGELGPPPENSAKDGEGGVEKLTVAAAVTRYVSMRLEEGMVQKSDTYRHITKHLGRLVRIFGEWTLASITTQHLREWEKLLGVDEDGREMSDVTQRHHLVNLKTFFKRCHNERWVEHDPARALVLPVIEEVDRNVISAKDAFHFFKVNRDAPCVGRIALEAFGGLRFSSAGRAIVDDIKFQRQGIEMPSNKHKSKKRKFRQGHPANLWAWLNHAPEECWTYTTRQYADEKKDMFVAAGLKPRHGRTEDDRARLKAMRNIWRGSFASYMLALVKNFGPVSYLMQHSNTKTTEVYEGRADELDARLYLGITPTSVLLSWEEYVSSVFVSPTPPLTPPP